jgi:hypothetical protein
VVAVGDLHGDLDNAEAVLRLAGVLGRDGRWSGGATTLVQTGDTTDRGPDSGAVLDLLRRLEPEASAAGGKVIALLGNHEVMNLLGDWRYVHPDDIRAYGGEGARKHAFSADGVHGAWLRSLPAVAQVEGVVFVHGGVGPAWSGKGIAGINQEVWVELQKQPSAGTVDETSVLGPTGPLWLRDLVQADEAAACTSLHRALADLGARRMVVGHTTRRDGKIQTRCAGRLSVIDTGIADGYGGNLAVWQVVAGDAVALYPSGPVDLEDPS